MASLTPINGVSVQLAGTETTIYTATYQTLGIVLHLANTSAAAKTVTIHVVPNGDTAADDTALCKDLSIPANDYIVLNVGNIAADTVISGLASSATSVTATILSGVERT
jgi:hypothetical protein